jgi:hypothetical protein
MIKEQNSHTFKERQTKNKNNNKNYIKRKNRKKNKITSSGRVEFQF